MSSGAGEPLDHCSGRAPKLSAALPPRRPSQTWGDRKHWLPETLCSSKLPLLAGMGAPAAEPLEPRSRPASSRLVERTVYEVLALVFAVATLSDLPADIPPVNRGAI